MLKNYFKTAYRSLIRNKVYTLINVLGLALGISCCLIIFSLVKFELNYDSIHSKRDLIYRVTGHFERDGASYHSPFTPFPMAEALRNDYPELDGVSQTYYNFRATLTNQDNEAFLFDNVHFADHEFLQLFDYEMIEGNRATCLKDPNSVVISQDAAEKLFGDEPAIGKSVVLWGSINVQVTGILGDIPENVHLPVGMLISYSTFNNDIYELDAPIESWDLVDTGSTYILLNPQQNPEVLGQTLDDFAIKYHGETFLENGHYKLQPLTEIHFDTRFADGNIGKTTDVTTIMGFAAIGIVLLLAACINFVNLSTAQSVKRGREVGVRKVMGAYKLQLVNQFLGETLVVSLLAAFISIVLVEILMPISNHVLGLQLSLNLFGDLSAIGFLVLLILIVTLLGGIYPAFVLSGFKPVKVLRSSSGNMDQGGLSLRKFLVLTQFLIAQVLMISTIVTYNQVEYFRSKPLGYSADRVINFGTGVLDSAQQQLFKNKLLENSAIESVSWFSSSLTSNGHLYGPYRLVDGDPNAESVRTTHRSVDEKYLETFGLSLAAGRNLRITAGNPEILVNETLLKRVGINDPQEAIGKKLKENWLIPSSTIVGVVKDFHNQSFHREIMPIIFFHRPRYQWRAGIKLSGSPEGVVAHLEDTYSELFPNWIINYQFEDQRLAEFYEEENKLFDAFQAFSLIAIAICALGLFGLVSFIANQKIKEVGIRKVLGAKLGHILILFGHQFLKPMLIAFAIAAPLGYYFMNEWLSNFVYSQEIGIMVFIVTILISFFIASSTVSYHSLKAAKTNPVDTLRYE